MTRVYPSYKDSQFAEKNLQRKCDHSQQAQPMKNCESGRAQPRLLPTTVPKNLVGGKAALLPSGACGSCACRWLAGRSPTALR
eukprot:14729923-Alexandrium_andersonii.AAC.1